MNKITTRTLPGFLNERGIGFDRMFELFDDATAYAGTQTYPPYNMIQVDEDNYIVELAVAGFAPDDIEIKQDANKLIISGTKTTDVSGDAEPAPEVNYLHRGISARNFNREYMLAEHVTVDEAEFEHGILSIKLHRELPDEMKPRTIAIKKIGK
jgi:molecular chaperone IbpA